MRVPDSERFLAGLTARCADLVEEPGQREALRALYREPSGTWVPVSALPGLDPWPADVRVQWQACPAEANDPGRGWAVLLFYVPALNAVAQTALHRRDRLFA